MPDLREAITGSYAGIDITLRPVEDSDLNWIRSAVLSKPVAKWWDTGDGGTWVDEVLTEEGLFAFIIEGRGKPVGYIQFEEEEDPSYKSASVDLFVEHTSWGNGYGKAALFVLCQWLFSNRGHHRIQIDPAAENARAIRVYESIGFLPIGIARERERTSAGIWRDSLLMELLRNPPGGVRTATQVG